MPRPDDLLHRDVPFAVVDVETTGTGTLQGDRITDIAIVQVLGGRVVEHFASLVNPERRIPMHITRLTGIDDAMVADAPVFRDVAPAIERALQQRVFVAHNVAFDWGFVNGELLRARRDALSIDRLCTVRLARRVLSHLPKRNLDSVAHHYGVGIRDRHRALGDALATANVLVGLLRDLERQGIGTWGELDGWLARRTGRKKRSALPTSSSGADGA